MKTNQATKIMAFLFAVCLSWFNVTSVKAQQKVDDKEIVGVWIMSSMKWEGEGKNLISDSYNQVKVYRSNGEYACAEIAKNKEGGYVILPHEYGTYTMKNGMYSEMGRNEIKHNWIDKTHFGGRWHNRIDEWKKVTNMPEKLTQHIVAKCKAAQGESDEMQKLLKQYVFSK